MSAAGVHTAEINLLSGSYCKSESQPAAAAAAAAGLSSASAEHGWICKVLVRTSGTEEG